MSYETKVAGEQAAAGVDILEQPGRAEHGTLRTDGRTELESAAIGERRQIVNVEVNWVVLAPDQPAAHVVKVGRR